MYLPSLSHDDHSFRTGGATLRAIDFGMEPASQDLVPMVDRNQLEKIFLEAKCGDLFEAAMTWCETERCISVEEFAEEDVFEMVVADIGTKRLQATRLRKAMESALSDSASTVEERDEEFEIRNTFAREMQASAQLLAFGNRAKTVSGNYSGHTGSVPERSIAGEHDVWTSPKGPGDETSPTQKSPSSILQRFQTNDDYGFDYHAPQSLLERYETHDDYGFISYTQAPGLSNLKEDERVSEETGAPLDLLVPSPGFVPPGVPATPLPMIPYGPMRPPMMPMMPMPMLDVYMPPSMTYPSMYIKSGADSKTMKTQTVEFLSKHHRRRDERNEERHHYYWTVDGKKVRGSDREAVSPAFKVKDCFDLEFKLVLKPKMVEYTKGGSSFKNSNGTGYIELRCVSDNDALMSCEATLSFKLSIKSARRQEKFRGPVFHNFKERTTCGLVDSQNEWDFRRIVDDTNTFVVILECDQKRQ
jgi:hypothetical protein